MRKKTLNLNKSQMAIIEYINDYRAIYGYSPTVREICDGVGLSSTSTVAHNLNVLEMRGYITKNPATPRSIVPTEKYISSKILEIIDIPIVGNIAAGSPIIAEENIQGYFPIMKDFVNGHTCFLLRVKGDSMINAGILNDDFVLVRQQDTVCNGDMAVALIDDSATIKTFYRENGYIRLQPENDAMDPIITADAKILGKVIGSMRMF